jgi:septal ring factor EnvC (AmiA/AmiB activator)
MINQIWRSRVVLPPEPELKELVHDVIAATTDIAQLKQTIEDLKGQLAYLDEQVAERTIKNGPYSSIWQRFKPETKDQWLNLLAILVPTLIAILFFMISNQLAEQQAKVTQEQQQQIVERIEEVNEHLEKAQDTDKEGVEQLKKIDEHLEKLEELEAQRDAPTPSPKPEKHR